MHLVDQILAKFEQMQIIQNSLGQRYADLSQIKYNKKEEYIKFENRLTLLQSSLQLKEINKDFFQIFTKRTIKSKNLYDETYTKDSGMF